MIATLLVALLAPNCARATVYHVDADAVGVNPDGLSWATAFVRLDDALAIAFFADEIRVAGGTYTPDPTGLAQPRTATFLLPADVHVSGGYAGFGAVDPDLRDLSLHETILSGDLNGDDNDPNGGITDNCHNVVTATELTGLETILEGFTITGGHSTAPFAPPFFPFGKPGGGMFVVGSRTLIDCTLKGNSALAGGGLFSFEGSMVLARCVFEGNSAAEGGALVLFGTDDPNPPRIGGGVVSGEGSVAHGTPQLLNCVFRDNHSEARAGAVWVDGIAENPTFTRCRWLGNSTGGDGGAVWSGGGFGDFNNCLFFDNTATERGGAVYSDTLTTFRNCSIVENHARAGGGLFNPFIRSTVIDSILWGNTSETAVGETAQADSGFLPPITDFSCVQGWSGSWGGNGNLGDDPSFVPGPAGCHYLSQMAAGNGQDSPCIDRGSGPAVNFSLELTTTGSEENADVAVVDMGFHYALTGHPLILGDADLSGSVDLGDWASFQSCFSGAGGGPVSPCCRVFDVQADGSVDLADLPQVLANLSGP